MKEQVSIQWTDEVDSTNSELLRHPDDYDSLSVLAAVRQTAGRGQRGNQWKTHDGENLTFSMMLRCGQDGIPQVAPKDQFGISIATTLGVCDYLSARGIESKIKWPNDIYVGRKKICGMLIESRLEKASMAFSVIGIGVNVNQKDFPPLAVTPTSVFLETGKEYDIKDDLILQCEALRQRYLKIGTQQEEFLSRLFQKDEMRPYTDCSDGSVFEGKIIGVTPFGYLKVETKKGELREFAFKEISYII